MILLLIYVVEKNLFKFWVSTYVTSTRELFLKVSKFLLTTKYLTQNFLNILLKASNSFSYDKVTISYGVTSDEVFRKTTKALVGTTQYI